MVSISATPNAVHRTARESWKAQARPCPSQSAGFVSWLTPGYQERRRRVLPLRRTQRLRRGVVTAPHSPPAWLVLRQAHTTFHWAGTCARPGPRLPSRALDAGTRVSSTYRCSCGHEGLCSPHDGLGQRLSPSAWRRRQPWRFYPGRLGPASAAPTEVRWRRPCSCSPDKTLSTWLDVRAMLASAPGREEPDVDRCLPPLRDRSPQRPARA